MGVAVDGTVRHYVGGVGAGRSMNLAHGYAARSGARAEFDERAPIMHPVLSGTNEVRASPGRSLSA